MKKALLLLFLTIVMSSSGSKLDYAPMNGDLIFQENDYGEFNKAVSAVTEGYKGRRVNHVGIVHVKDGSSFVIEGRDIVQEIPLKEFLNRSLNKSGEPNIIVGRLKEKYRVLIPGAIEFAVRQIGKPYNDSFDIDTHDKWYCSQLVYEAFKQSNGNRPLFELKSMTFKEPESGNIYPVWQEYFAKLKIPVPEGKPGINPGAMSRSVDIDIIGNIYVP